VKPLRIGFNPDFAPFAEVKDGEPDGLVIARLRAALHNAGLDATFLPVTLPEMTERLRSGDLDALAGVAISAERSRLFSFSRPLARTGGAWFPLVGADWPGDQALREAAPGTWRVVSPRTGPLVAQIRDRFPNLEVIECEDYAAAFEAVLGGLADAAALNLQVGRLQAERDHPDCFALPQAPFFEVPLAMAVAKGDPLGLIARLDPHFEPDIDE